jgi:hypothetical protein
LPQLFAHFKDHCQEDPGMDISQYIQLHYSADHPNDQDDDEDNELPFKETQLQHIDVSDIPYIMEMNFIVGYHSVGHPGKIGEPLIQIHSIFRPPQAV